MSFDNDAFNAAVERARGDADLAEAVQAARDLIALWPLTKAQHMENDEKYAENLQVRLTRQFALLAGQNATMPDAEYVYEGAEAIPGRDQVVVDTLLDANDVYDESQEFSDDLDASHLTAAFGAEHLGLDGGAFAAAGTKDGFASTVAALLELLGALDENGVPARVGAMALDERVAFCVIAFAALLDAGATAGEGAEGDRIAIPALLAVNEFAEVLGVPRAAVKTDDVAGLRVAAGKVLLGAAAGTGTGEGTGMGEGTGNSDGPDAFVALIAPMIRDEWKHHHEEVLWDPDEAERKAKEEDEKRNKEALAAKFAHIKDDPNKEHVEL